VSPRKRIFRSDSFGLNHHVTKPKGIARASPSLIGIIFSVSASGTVIPKTPFPVD
jgi:hypothetical protein